MPVIGWTWVIADCRGTRVSYPSGTEPESGSGLTTGSSPQEQEARPRASSRKSLFMAYSRLKMNTQLMAATMPMICGTVGKAAYRIREMTHMMTGAQASASGATIIALP